MRDFRGGEDLGFTTEEQDTIARAETLWAAPVQTSSGVGRFLLGAAVGAIFVFFATGPGGPRPVVSAPAPRPVVAETIRYQAYPAAPQQPLAAAPLQPAYAAQADSFPPRSADLETTAEEAREEQVARLIGGILLDEENEEQGAEEVYDQDLRVLREILRLEREESQRFLERLRAGRDRQER